MVYKEWPELGKWVSKNQTVNKYTLANIICEILDEKYERVWTMNCDPRMDIFAYTMAGLAFLIVIACISILAYRETKASKKWTKSLQCQSN